MLLLYYLTAITIAGLIITAYDKLAAIKRLFRIPEKFLYILCAAGGGAGVILAFCIFRHKTRKHKVFVTAFLLSVISYIAFAAIYLLKR